MRQGCVLSPRLFSCVLELAFGRWRRKVGNAGMDFEDGIRTLFDLRFADIFLITFEETKFLLDELVTCLAEVGLQMNVGKTKILTTQSRSPRKCLFGMDRKLKSQTVALNINGWDACVDLFWSTRMLQSETVSSILTPRSLLLLVSVLLTNGYCVSPATAFHCWATW